MLIYFLFKPIKITQQEFVDVPLLNVETFTLYELNTKGLKTIMAGKRALRFSDRYSVDSIDFTDNSKEFVSNMKANYGAYKENMIDLKGDVVYVREDGVTFNTDTMQYDTNTSIATTTDPYTANMDENYMKGIGVVYNAEHKQMKSQHVQITYKIDEDK